MLSLIAGLLALATLTSASPSAIVSPPRLIAGSIAHVDYPGSALRNGEEGTTRSRITLDADGNVTNCSVAGTSGHSTLDQNACQAILRRLTFSPARDAEGRGVPAKVVVPLRWAIEPDRLPVPAPQAPPRQDRPRRHP